MGEHNTGRGRPRDAATEQAIVDATIAELEERGYRDVTIESVARRAGVGRPTVYRRWADKELLVVHVLSVTVPPLAAPDTGDPVEDLRMLVTDFVRGVGRSPASRALLAIHAESGHRPELAEALRERYLFPRAEVLASALARVRAAGVLRPGTSDELARDLLFGPPIYHWLMTARTPDAELLDSLLDRSLAAVTTRGSGASNA